MSENKSFGLRTGIGLSITGIIFILVNVIGLYFSNYYFPKLLIAGCALVTLGISVLFVRGISPPENTPANMKVKVWWKSSSMLNKIIWIIAGGAGIGIGFYIALQINPHFI